MKKLLSIFLLSFFILTISLALYALDPVCFHQCQDIRLSCRKSCERTYGVANVPVMNCMKSCENECKDCLRSCGQ